MSLGLQIRDFILHLRLHYQLLILSGGYLLASLSLPIVDWATYWQQFVNVHVLLFGGATAYNSFWDKDEGPIGGLKNPPKMKRWMWAVSLAMQFAGLVWASTIGTAFIIIYAISLVLFWLYSTPHARWKGHPLLSLIAIGISTGTNSFLMGVLAAGKPVLDFTDGMIALGVAMIVLSLYPASQLFQFEEDKERGDVTFAMKFGIGVVRYFFVGMFLGGSALIAAFFYTFAPYISIIFFILSTISLSIITLVLFRLKGVKEEYRLVMLIKFVASLGFLAFILSSLLIKSIIG